MNGVIKRHGPAPKEQIVYLLRNDRHMWNIKPQ